MTIQGYLPGHFMYLNFRTLRGLIFAGVLALAGTTFATNRVYNGGFELREAGWNFDFILNVRVNTRSAEGSNHMEVVTRIWQDIPTIPGESYYIQFAYNFSAPAIAFDGVPMTLTPVSTPVPGAWPYLYAIGTATGNVARLEFIGSSRVDDVSVIGLHDPLELLSQPEDRSAFEGASVSFMAKADGGPPISYLWHRNGIPIDGTTNSALFLSNVEKGDAGQYSVLVSNVTGTLWSTSATLAVESAPTAPLIVVQPMGDTVPEGYVFHLAVSAFGKETLTYQWLRNNEEIPNATNRTLSFSPVSLTNEGTYTVRVANGIGSSLSLPASLSVTAPAAGGGWITFRTLGAIDGRPLFDLDGVTKLSGSNYFAQLYVGTTPTTLRPAHNPVPFLNGSLAGYFTAGMIRISDIPPGQLMYVQTRVWESAAGISLEDARARGGKWGTSPVLTMIAGQSSPAPAVNVPNAPFNLRAGSPLFSTGSLTVNRRGSGAPVEWKLTGASNSRYLIEKRTPPQSWNPLFVVTNISGTVLFTDTNENSGHINFYRSRMLD